MEQPEYLKAIRARGKWLGGRVNDLYVCDFPVMRSDEPPHNEGPDTRPRRWSLRFPACAPEQEFQRPGWLKK